MAPTGITLPPLVDAAETEPPPFVTSYNLNGREVALAIRPNIVTADFLEGLDARTQEERRQRLAAAARAAPRSPRAASARRRPRRTIRRRRRRLSPRPARRTKRARPASPSAPA